MRPPLQRMFIRNKRDDARGGIERERYFNPNFELDYKQLDNPRWEVHQSQGTVVPPTRAEVDPKPAHEVKAKDPLKSPAGGAMGTEVRKKQLIKKGRSCPGPTKVGISMLLPVPEGTHGPADHQPPRHRAMVRRASPTSNADHARGGLSKEDFGCPRRHAVRPSRAGTGNGRSDH